MTFHKKFVFAMVSVAVLSMGAYLLVASWQSQRQSESARQQIQVLVESSTVDTSAAIIRLIAAQDENLRKQVEAQLNVARYLRSQMGAVSVDNQLVSWRAMNQLTRKTKQVVLPRLLIGGQWLGQNNNLRHRTPLIDDEFNLVGGTMTLFQRMDTAGDMIRIATNVKRSDGTRAIGTYIPAITKNGKHNPVIETLLRGDTYRGVAWVVNHYYVSCYEPLFDRTGKLIGAIYTGEREENGAGLREAITRAPVGKSGRILVISGNGDRQGTCLISSDNRNGKDLTHERDINGFHYADRILKVGMGLKEGATAVVHYTLGTSSDPVPVAARVARYTPWGWVVVTESHPQDFAEVYSQLYNSGNATVVAFILIGAVMVVLTLPLIWVESNERARRDAERANTAKSEFLSRMSHELRTPMNAILGFAQLLEMDDLNAEQSDSVRQIRTAGQHLLRLINEVLDISKIEAGALTLSMEEVSVYEVISEVKSLIQPMADQRGITVIPEISERERRAVNADRQRILQVLLNLVSNAVKYNRPNGSVKIYLRDHVDGKIRICVEDTGFGIPPDRADHMFIPFDRLGAEKTSIEGTGLGLTLSKRLIEAMNGSIGFESSEAGTIFYVDMASMAVSDLDTLMAFEDEVPYVPVGEARTILMIEDNDSNIKLVERLVSSRTNHRLLISMLGGLGYELAIEHRPDLILMDMDLPDMHGTELYDRFRNLPETAHTPIIILSADASPSQIERLLGAGAYLYMTKPLDVRQFLGALDELFGTPVEDAA